MEVQACLNFVSLEGKDFFTGGEISFKLWIATHI
jgi:hypothetical protein